jgi:hypothetical protein
MMFSLVLCSTDENRIVVFCDRASSSSSDPVRGRASQVARQPGV